MEARVNYAVVGAFVLVLGAAMIAGVLWLSSGKTFRQAYDLYYIYMTESVSGLNVDAPVRYRGVQVGAVRRIALAPGNIEEVQLLVAIERGTPVKQDTVAELRVQGLTGIAHVELTGGSQAAPRLEVARPGEEYPAIRSDPSLLVRLDASVTTLLTNLNTSSERVNALLDDHNRAAFKELLANLHALSRTLAARSATIDAGLANASKAMENTARVTAEMSQLVERIRKSADAFDRMAGEGAKAGAAASSAIEGARAEAREFAGDALPEVRALLAELRELSGSLRRLGDEIERNPSVLIRGRAALKPGPGE
jgi:phospholipid/cholesterol/gamma-HCH transport system substrate-binding protein